MTYARAMGPMQFLPGTWSRYAADGDGDGKADVQNVFDATLAAARYLCSGGLNLRDPTQVMAAILRYNNSIAYARNVLGWAAAYATGVVPVDLPPITGPVPPLGDAHLDNYQGLGPGLPLNALGLPADDPLALMPMMAHGDVASQLYRASVPGQRWARCPACTVPAGAAARSSRQPQPWLPPWMQQPPPRARSGVLRCAGSFCIRRSPPAASRPRRSRCAAAPGDAQMLMPPAPPAARSGADRRARRGPCCRHRAAGPAPGPA